jgi:hypothetical protein
MIVSIIRFCVTMHAEQDILDFWHPLDTLKPKMRCGLRALSFVLKV